MKTKIDERTAGQFLLRKLQLNTGASVFEGRVVDFLTHLRHTAPDRANTPTEFFTPSVHREWPLRGSLRVTRAIDGKRFELVMRKKGFISREVKKG